MAWWGKYVGLPYGGAPGEMECWALVVAVLADQKGLDLPAYSETSAAYLEALVRLRAGEISAQDARLAREAVAAEIEAGRAAECWLPVAEPAPFDVAIMASPAGGRHPVHCGVMVDPWHVLHTTRATGAVMLPVAHHAVPPVLEYRRHRSL